MNTTILVTTDFSESSKNALDYACGLAADTGKEVLLTHIYVIPAGYAAESLSLATINDSMDSEKGMLQAELERVNSAFPAVNVAIRMVIGNFVETLVDLCTEICPEMTLIGAYGEYSDFILWESEWLRVVTSVPCPVLVVPIHKKYEHCSKMAFACDYKKACTALQEQSIRRWVKAMDATLHIVHITQQETAGVVENPVAAQVKRQFSDISIEFHVIANKPVIEALADFVRGNSIDLLIVIPRAHSFWHSLFNKSYSRQLVQLGDTPVLAIHEHDM